MNGHFVWDIDPVFCTFFGLEIRYYSILFCIGFNIAVLALLAFLLREKVKEDDAFSLIIYIFISLQIGLRLFEALFYSTQLLDGNILEILLPIKITEGGIQLNPFSGLSGHGAILGIIIVLFIFCKSKGLSFLNLCDHITPYVCIAGALVRIGNFCNSEILGPRTNSFLGVIFLRVDTVPRYPVQLFESASYFFIAFLHFIILRFLVKGREDKFRSGFTASLTIVLVYISRVLLEFIKDPVSYNDLSLSMNLGVKYGQLLSFGFILIFLIVLLYRSPLYFFLKKKEIS